MPNLVQVTRLCQQLKAACLTRISKTQTIASYPQPVHNAVHEHTHSPGAHPRVDARGPTREGSRPRGRGRRRNGSPSRPLPKHDRQLHPRPDASPAPGTDGLGDAHGRAAGLDRARHGESRPATIGSVARSSLGIFPRCVGRFRIPNDPIVHAAPLSAAYTKAIIFAQRSLACADKSSQQSGQAGGVRGLGMAPASANSRAAMIPSAKGHAWNGILSFRS